VPIYDDPPLHDFPDRAIRRLLEHPANLADVLAAVAPTLAPHFDCTRAELVNREFTLQNWQQHELDLLFRIPFRADGEEQAALVCVLVEHQSRPDPVMPLRMLVYAVLYWQRQWQQWAAGHEDAEPLRLNLVLPIVFHTGPRPWRTNRSLNDLFPGIDLLQSLVPVWPILVWDITEHEPRELLDSARAWLQALAVVRAERTGRDEFHGVLTEVLRRLEIFSSADSVRWKDLLWFVLSWSMRRRPPEEKDDWQQTVLTSQENAVHNEEVHAVSEVAWKTMEDVVEERGELKGRRNALKEVLEEKFGPLPEPLIQRIDTTADLDRLRAAARQVLHISALDELAL
jgi:hypothetical protein